MEFSEVYERYADDIAVTALSQKVPGLDYDDVVSEMTACLWKAWKTYKAKHGSFGSYWWSLWLNRRSDIATAAYRVKRPRLVPVGEHLPEGRYLMDLLPHPPKDSTPEEKLVWTMLAQGVRPTEVMIRCGLSRRGYYNLIRGWRTEEVHRLLSES